MNVLFLFDVAPSGTVIGGVIGVAFFFLFLGVAFVAFKALKKTVKMALRMSIVAVILLIGIVGSIALWYLSSAKSPRLKAPKPVPTRSR